MNLYVQLPPLKKMKKTDQTIPGVSHSFEDLYTYGFFFFSFFFYNIGCKANYLCFKEIATLSYMRFKIHTDFQVPLSDGTESVFNAGDPGLNPGQGRSPGERNGYPLQYSCLENPMERGGWQTTVHGVAKTQTRLND